MTFTKGHKRNLKHGMHRSSEWVSWYKMRERCYDPLNNMYHLYGGRGITICKEWELDFAKFYADLGPKPTPKHTIERRDSNGNYELSNCYWASKKEQARNNSRIKATPEQVKQILEAPDELSTKKLAEQVGLKYHNVWDIRRGRTWVD